MSATRAVSRILMVATAGLVLAVVGCSDPSEREGPAPTTTISPSGPNDVDTEVPAPLPSPTWDQAGREGATATATTVMTTFIDHREDAAAWWSELEPMFSPLAAADYAGTEPAQVPARQVTGPADLVEEGSAFLATVSVPTDVGAYQVLLSRAGDGQPWLVERLSPPEAVSAG